MNVVSSTSAIIWALFKLRNMAFLLFFHIGSSIVGISSSARIIFVGSDEKFVVSWERLFWDLFYPWEGFWIFRFFNTIFGIEIFCVFLDGFLRGFLPV